MLSSKFIPNPQSGEHVILSLRRHPIALAFSVLMFVLQCAMGIALFFLLQRTIPQALSIERFRVALVLLGSIYALVIWVLFFQRFVDYYLDLWIATSHRLIHIEQDGLFSRHFAEQRLSRIQDVTSEMKGIMPTLFHYGNVHIQTAGAQERITFKQVRRPEEIARRIHELIASTHNNHTNGTS